MRKTFHVLALLLLMGSALGQQFTVTGHVQIVRPQKVDHPADESDVVVWLVPLSVSVPLPAAPQAKYSLVQKDKRFRPHVLVIPKGSEVEFPNRDPFFHNVFSLFNGKRFDLGLYEAGSSRKVRFDREGVSYIFCNIHPEMSAVVLALRTPFFTQSDAHGNISIPNVPSGEYELHTWYEKADNDEVKTDGKRVNLSAKAHSLGTIRVAEVPNFSREHPNKFGDPYGRSSTASPY